MQGEFMQTNLSSGQSDKGLASPRQSQPSDLELARWRRTLLPTMQVMLVSLTIFFFAATFWQLYYLQNNIFEGTKTLEETIPDLLTDEYQMTSQERLNAVHLQALIKLESYVLRQRYHHANVLLMSGVWVRYLGFVTGMILALVGATFVMGRLETPPSEVKGSISELQWQLQSSSPGLIMVVLGVLLMLATVVMQHSFSVKDNSIFLNSFLATDAQFNSNEDPVPSLPPEEPLPVPEETP